MHPILTKQQIDKLYDIFDGDKSSALHKMLKSGWFHKSSQSIDAVDEKGIGLLSRAAFNNAGKCMKVLLEPDEEPTLGCVNHHTNDWRVYSDCY